MHDPGIAGRFSLNGAARSGHDCLPGSGRGARMQVFVPGNAIRDCWGNENKGASMGDVIPSATFDGYFRSLGRRSRVVLFQLPLSVTMLLVIFLAEVFHPGLLQPGAFLYSLGVHLLLLAACALVPWARLPKRAWVVIPVLDCLAVGLTREAADEYLTVLGFLLVFPVVWLSLGRHRSGVLMAVAATILSAVLPPAVLGTGVNGPSLIRIVLLPVILGAISLTAHVVSNAVLRQREQLEQQDKELQELLAASEKRERLLGTIMDTVSVGVCAVDEQGRKILMNRQQTRHIAGALGEDPHTPGSKDIPLYSMDRKHRLPADRHPLHRAANGETFTDELIWFGTGTDQRAY